MQPSLASSLSFSFRTSQILSLPRASLSFTKTCQTKKEISSIILSPHLCLHCFFQKISLSPWMHLKPTFFEALLSLSLSNHLHGVVHLLAARSSSWRLQGSFSSGRFSSSISYFSDPSSFGLASSPCTGAKDH